MKDFKKDFQAVIKQLGFIMKKIVRLSEAMETIHNPTSTEKPRAVEKAAGKKSPKDTASDSILRIIKMSRKGVTLSVLKEKTGFNEKKIQNIIYKLKKQEKIKSESKGIYMKT